VLLDLPHALQSGISRHGLRNSHLLAAGPDRLAEPLAQPGSQGIEPLAMSGRRLVPVAQQLELAARVQACVDNAVTVNIHVPKAMPAVAYAEILRRAWTLRLKNCLVQHQH
jgi:hypothetical protein